MIKRYQDFLAARIAMDDKLKLERVDLNTDELEHLDDTLTKLDLTSMEKDFLHKFNQVVSSLDYPSYTNVVSSGRYDFSSDLSKVLQEVGISFDEIQENKDLIWKNIKNYSDLNGGVDLLLYSLDKSYHLGGGGLDLADGSTSSFDELVVKFEYGYHNTYYGEIYLLQYFTNLKEYFTFIIGNIITCMFLSNRSSFSDFFKSYRGNFDGCVKRVEDYWIIDTSLLYDQNIGDFKGLSGPDMPYQVFQLLVKSVESFLEAEIEEGLVEVETIQDEYIKISLL